jgi:outer membrane protein OmpA-like peptidoglycan-associated protein
MNTKLTIGIALALSMAACATVPLTDPALENARSAVRSAESDPNVEKYAALDLHSARDELAEAEAAAVRRDARAIDQPAYMAAQTAHLAQLRASAKANDARVAAGQADRDQIQLRARTREINRADAARDNANQRAQLANAAADQATLQAAQAQQQAAQATQQSADLQAEVDALKAKPTDRGLVLTLGDVLFETGKADLNTGASRNLDRLVQFLADHPERRVEIDGYTDSVGTDSFNLDLSQRRADTVKSVLVNRGIDSSRVTTRGYGKDFNVASNSDSGGRQLNRRVEVVIGGADGAAVAARSRT